MNYSIDSLIRFITVVAFSVIGMFTYFFSIYLKLAIEKGLVTALQDGLLVVVMVGVFWLGGSLFSRPKPPVLQTWIKGTRFGIVAILGMILLGIVRHFVPSDTHITERLINS